MSLARDGLIKLGMPSGILARPKIPVKIRTKAPNLVIAREIPNRVRACRMPRPIRMYVRKIPRMYVPAMRLIWRGVFLRETRKPMVRRRTEMAQGLMLSSRAANVTTGKVKFIV